MLRGIHTLKQDGFTLIELISVMVIMGVMASVSVKKFDLLTDSASNRVLAEATKELSIREHLTWTNQKLSQAGWLDDAGVFAQMGTDLGGDFVWTAGPDASGGTIKFRSQSIALTRVPSTKISAGYWK